MRTFMIRATVMAGLLIGSQAFAQEQKRERPQNEEQKKIRQELLQKYDANKDGKLDDEERKNITSEEKKKLRDARLSPEQKKVRDEIFQKYDTNKDGKLDKEERGKITAEDLKKAHDSGVLGGQGAGGPGKRRKSGEDSSEKKN